MKRAADRIKRSTVHRSSSLVSRVRLQAAVEAGFRDARMMEGAQEIPARALKMYMRDGFCEHVEASLHAESRYEAVQKIGKAYIAGFAAAYPYPIPRFVLLPTRKRLAIVLSALNEQEGIGSVLAELERLSVDEIIVIVNGSTDETFDEVRRHSNEVLLIHYPYRLGHDIGRAIGAKIARADAVLFADSDFPVSAEQLGAFLWSVEQGVDVALNDLRPLMGRFDEQDSISHVKKWLNLVLGRHDLEVNSMTAIPHALSRKAIEMIGVQHLSVPPKAHAIAIMRGLKVESVQTVDVITRNKVRDTNVGPDNPVSQLITGDHIEAVQEIWNQYGDRLNEPQQVRSRIATRRNSS